MIKKLITIGILCGFLAVSVVALLPKESYAIPPFAQKYHFTCAVCHTTFPNLNPFGRAFWRNGFRLPETNGTPADATQITQGLSLPNPWPVPISSAQFIQYQHYTNENVNPSTDQFSVSVMLDTGGSFKLYTPLANSLSWFDMNNITASGFSLAQLWASLNGLGSGFGVPSHLFNLKIGMPNTAGPYFDKQVAFVLIAPGAAGTGPATNVQGLDVGYDGEADMLINDMMGDGLELYGTPGYHLWYKITVTNDDGMMNNLNGKMANNAEAANLGFGNENSNAMQYSYQIKEYYPTSMGQLEFGYYGATMAEPRQLKGAMGSWTNRITDNGVDVDLANNIYELGATYMVQNDSNPYGNPSVAASNIKLDGNVVGNTHSSNGYSTFEIYGRYLFPQIGNGLMFTAEYAQYSWTHKDLQEGWINNNPTSCENNNLYQYGAYTEINNGCQNEGIKDNLDLQVEYSLAFNAHLYLEYMITNKAQDDTLGSGLAFAF